MMAESQDQPMALSQPQAASTIPRPIAQPPPYEPLQPAQVKPVIRERRMSNPPAFPLHNYLKDTTPQPVFAAAPVAPVAAAKPQTRQAILPLDAYLKPKQPESYQPRPAIQPQALGELVLMPALLPEALKRTAPMTSVVKPSSKIHPSNIPNSRRRHFISCNLVYFFHLFNFFKFLFMNSKSKFPTMNIYIRKSEYFDNKILHLFNNRSSL
jgi:hypothetical protein